MSAEKHRLIIKFSLILYLIATWSSMAGMEIFGWLTFLLITSYVLRKPVDEPITASTLGNFLPWKSLLLLLLITILAAFINGTPQMDRVFSIGSMRWMFLLATTSFALSLWPPGFKGYRVFLIFISIIGVYAVFQSVTGIDLLRPGTNRAVQPLDLTATFPLWRSAGLFGSPLQYGYIAGQHVALPLAVVLLTFHRRRQFPWLFWGSLVAFTLVAFSLVTTFTRGAWIAMLVAWFLMATLVSKKLTAWLIAGATSVFAVLYASVEMVRSRAHSLFDLNYASNSDRMFLWKTNWEIFKDYPILGIGYQENEVRAGEYVARLGRPDAFTGHAHNNYLQMLAGTGLTGFLTYMFIICFMLLLTWRLWKSLPKDLLWPRALTLAALGAQIHLHVGGFTECNFKAGATNHNFMVVWGIVIALSTLQAKGLLNKKFESYSL